MASRDATRKSLEPLQGRPVSLSGQVPRTGSIPLQPYSYHYTVHDLLQRSLSPGVYGPDLSSRLYPGWAMAHSRPHRRNGYSELETGDEADAGEEEEDEEWDEWGI